MRRSALVKWTVALAAVVLCAVAAFHGTEEGGALFVYCGAGIRPAMEAVRKQFTQETGIPVQVTYAGSGCLLSMLTFARSGDLYVPGERYYLEQAQADGYINDEAVAAHFVAVVMVQKGNPKGIRSLDDLARPDVRVGIGQTETVACGLVAKRLLEGAGVWDVVKANIDARGAYTGTAVELSNALCLNAIDAAINWDAMAYLVRDEVDILTIPREKNIDVDIPVATLSWSQRKPEAAKFMAFVVSEAGKRCFGAHGYHTSLDPYVLPYYGDVVVD